MRVVFFFDMTGRPQNTSQWEAGSSRSWCTGLAICHAQSCHCTRRVENSRGPPRFSQCSAVSAMRFQKNPGATMVAGASGLQFFLLYDDDDGEPTSSIFSAWSHGCPSPLPGHDWRGGLERLKWTTGNQHIAHYVSGRSTQRMRIRVGCLVNWVSLASVRALKIDWPMVCMYDAEVFALYIAFAVRAGGTIWVEDPELFCLSLLVISFFPSHVRFCHISLAFQEYPHYDFPRTFQGLFLSPIWADPPLPRGIHRLIYLWPYGFWIHLGPVNIGCNMLQSIYPLLRKQLFIWHSLRTPLLTIGIPLSFSQTEPNSNCEISGLNHHFCIYIFVGSIPFFCWLNHNFLLHKIQFSARFSDLEVLAMMNVVTGVFVESALGSAREDQKHWPKMGEPYDYDICVDNVSIKIWIDWNSLD